VTDILFMLIVGIATLILQTTSLAFLIPVGYKPDLILVLVAWGSLRMPFTVAAGFAFLAGILIDLLSGSPMGLFAIIYCAIFVMCGYCQATLQLEGPVAQGLVIFCLTLISGAVALLTRWIAGPVEFGWHAAQWIMLKSLFTGFASAILLPLLDRLRKGYIRLVGAY
jgi:rod shape-determining protein MreD